MRGYKERREKWKNRVIIISKVKKYYKCICQKHINDICKMFKSWHSECLCVLPRLYTNDHDNSVRQTRQHRYLD